MKIKNRLSTYFTLFTATILIVVLSAIYFTFLQFLQADFFKRLKDRTMVTAELYLEADEISRDSLSKIRDKYLEKIPGEVLRIYNSNNSAVFIGDTQQYWSNAIINKVRKSKLIQFKDNKRQVVGISYKDNQGDFVILASAEDVGTQRRMSNLLKIMLVIFIVICISLWLMGRWFAKKTLSPIDKLIEQVKQIKSVNLHYRLDEGNGKDEISLLASHFNTLLIHLENAFELQKTFVANASHELRTPITSIIMGADVMLSQERDKEDYKATLSSVKEDAEKLNKIITVLLDLAKADIDFATAITEKTSMKDLFTTLQQEWNTKHYENALSLQVPENQLLIMANTSLLSIAINNIIANAFKFSNNRSVACTVEYNAQEVIISIKDSGIGIPEKDLTHIFKPFYRSSSAAGMPGNGLGLYMSKKIINLFRGEIYISSKENETTVTIRLPLI